MSRKRTHDGNEGGKRDGKRKRLPKQLEGDESHYPIWGQRGMFAQDSAREMYESVINFDTPRFRRAEVTAAASAVMSDVNQIGCAATHPTTPLLFNQHALEPTTTTIGAWGDESSFDFGMSYIKAPTPASERGSRVEMDYAADYDALGGISSTSSPLPHARSGPPPIPHWSRPDRPSTSMTMASSSASTYTTSSCSPVPSLTSSISTRAESCNSCYHRSSRVRDIVPIDVTVNRDTPLIAMPTPIVLPRSFPVLGHQTIETPPTIHAQVHHPGVEGIPRKSSGGTLHTALYNADYTGPNASMASFVAVHQSAGPQPLSMAGSTNQLSPFDIQSDLDWGSLEEAYADLMAQFDELVCDSGL
ncbi:hypothetical protein CERSUDRAFT_123861 [Gelatoporia subvermispora B]|uniref:Uncharacterized protein n=1 Tax=Ceriporiopsis subvermispora (strain B) TaxID=914234 RepID=M2REC4_CERS8|nr:hypothetical protein CERSUDRAFT_123861 [Gelatoporia subvermispora B]